MDSERDVLEREEVKNFFEEMGRPDILGVVVKAHLYAESKLIRLLEESLPRPQDLDLERLGFARKLNVAVAVGAPPERLNRPLRLLNGLRNKFAHDLRFKVSEANISEILGWLRSEGGKKLKEQFPNFESMSVEAKLRGVLIGIDAQLLACVDSVIDEKQKTKSV